jgi:N-acetylneuraminic acid mutarotase
VLSEEALRRRAEDALRMSLALETLWGTPISAAQLQAELDRMARGSRRPDVLQRLFSALDDDPLLIAEVLARPALAERLLRARFASDSRVHGELRRRVQRAVASVSDLEALRDHGADYQMTRWRLERGSDAADTRALAEPEWSRLTRRLAARLGGPEAAGTPSEVPNGRIGDIEETDTDFRVIVILSRTEQAIQVASASWRKQSFDEWWRRERQAHAGSPLPLTGSYRLPRLALGDCADDTWRQVPSGAAPDARSGHTAVWTGTEMIVWGGFTEALETNTGGRYDPATDTWRPTSLGPDVPAPRSEHTAVWTGTEMIVWGDAGATGGRYDPVNDSWQPTGSGSGVPSTRWSHTAVWTGSGMIVWGGFAPGGGSSRRTGGVYDPATDTWRETRIAEATPSARGRHTAVWAGNRMIVWGGEKDIGSSVVFRNGGSYDPVSDTWSSLSLVNAPAARSRHKAVWTGSRLIVWGGFNGRQKYFASGGRYNPATDSWQAMKLEGAPSGRFDHAAVWSGTHMIVWGGFNGAGDPLATGGRYNPAANSWTATSTGPGVPPASTDTASVWTGTELIVWGGSICCGNDEVLATGGRYNPATDTWVPTSPGPFAPRPRTRQASAWTGAELIVWGGSEGVFLEVNTGGRYDPATDTWSATSLHGAPTPRLDTTAVWTGSEVVVWGGYEDGFTAVNTGGRYQPADDAWQPTSVGADVPAGRASHAAVWSGSEVIVWGGSDGNGGRYNSGGRYDPVSDSWRPTSPAGAPSARPVDQPVWTGSEMIVWGGQANQYLNTGGRYDPIADAWQPTTLVNAPSARRGFTSVWTGSEMIVWGGWNSGWFDDGARYDPSADAWTPVSNVGAPSDRDLHVAVWTGAEMIVWGGRLIGINTGGRYSPATDSWRPTSTGDGTPMGRGEASAAWTGSEMVVWGGTLTHAAGGAYCAADP